MRKIRHFFLTAAAVLCSTLTTWAAYNGTPAAPTQISGNYADYGLSADFDGYYVISTAAELYGFAELVNGGTTSANAVLTANIEVNENVLKADGTLNGTPTYSWTPIGTNANQFNGTFDGNNHTISGLYFNNTTKSNYPDGGKYVGLIGYANVATIKNVGVVGSYIWAYENVGGICGYCYSANTIITNCYNTGTVSGSSTSVGGICGFYGTQTNCHNTGTVTGSSNVGGVCGSAGILNKCYNTGTVSGSSSGVGGICGNSGTQTNSYNTGTVTGSSNVGGICGYIGTQTDCYYLEGCGSKNTRGVSATAEEFASGKITYLLNGSTSEGDLAWYQTLGSGGDAYPLLDNTHAVVYATQPCISEFSNENNNARKEHSQMNATGCCTDCGQYIAQGATVVTESNYSGLNLTADFIGYYAISNSPDLYWFAKEVYNGSTSINAVLTADIVVNENVLTAEGELNGTPTYSWTPIGTSSQKYAGTFDGNGHTISGLYFNNTTNRDYPNGGKYAGLIGYAYGATIKNVGVIGSYIRGDQYVSGICGYGSNSSGTNTTITNCYNTGMVTGSAEYVGGICGSGGVQTNCHNTGMVSGFKYVGGICGQYGTQTKCYNTGTITSSSSSSSSVGGICGSYGTQTNCYNTGTVSGSGNYVGGICGYCYYNVTPTNCYNTGTVSGYYDYSGGICGNKENSGVEVKPTNCYYLAGCCRKDGGGVSATAEVFASGKITYLLNGSTSGDDNTWRQTFGNGGDAYPVLDNTHGVVYASQPCTSEFSNKNNDARKEHPSMNAAGHCTACDQFIAQGTLVTESNYSGLNLTADFIGYYAIGNSGELYWLANEVNNGNNTINAVLTADIVVNENVLNADGTLNGTPTYSWTPIGTWDKTFNGTFDGNGHIISGLYFNNTTDKNSPNGGNNVGLIGYANGAKGTKIKNVGVIDSYIRGRSNVGGICGCGLNYTNITNCYNTGTVSGSSNGIGGICGYDGNITNCYNTGMVSGSSYYVGGICGSGGKQTNCYYLEGCAKDGNNVEQYGVGANQKGQTTADVEGKTISATAAEYASGKIAYMLNGGTFEVTTWRQTLFADASPVLNTEHNIVTGYVTEAENVITVTGDLVVATDYEIAEGKTLTVPEGASLTILEGASLTIPEGALLTTTGEAVITNNGTIIANGSISGNNLAGNGSFIYNALSANDVALVKTSFIYKGSAFTLDDDVEATISNRTFCGKTFSFDASLTSVSYKNNRNVGDNGTVTWTNTNGSSVSKTFSITPKTLAISNIKAENKTYDGNTTTSVSYTTDKVEGDDVTFGTTATFADKNAGNGKAVSFDYTKSGADAANYAFANATGTATANITARTLTLSNFVANGKTYDGTTNATGGAFSDNRVSGDVLEFTYNYSFENKNVGTNKNVNFSNIAISGGADKGNYTLAATTGVAKADITVKTLAISNIKAENKVYDGNTATTVSYTADVFSGDDVTFGTAATFADKNVGTGKAVSFNYTKSGADAANYAFANESGSTTANITARTLTLSNFVADGKTYDGTTNATGGSFSDDRVSGDVLDFTYDYSFENKNAGTNKNVNFSNIAISSGADKGNYTLAATTGTAKANITAKGLTLNNFTAGDKTFDGTTNATGGAFSDDRVSGDALEFSFNYAFANMNAANAVAVNFSNIAISGGADKDNYSLLTTTGTCNAKISPVTDEVVLNFTMPTRTVMYNGQANRYEMPTADELFSTNNELYRMYGGFQPADNDAFQAARANVLAQTEVGEYTFGYNSGTLVNTSANFTNVKFNVTDGKLIITPNTNVVVTITENSSELTYNTEEQRVEGYTYSINDELNIYSEEDFSFSGNAVAAGTTVGTYPMELSAADFSNTNSNFADVTFNIVDGALTITKAPVAPNKPEAAIETRYINTQLVALPADWAWSEYAALAMGNNTATANYTGADKGNYQVESVDVTITRLECLHNDGNEVLYTLEPTCTHKGYTGNLSCKLCGVIYEMGDSIPALGHDFVETVIVPTCTAVGYTEHLCNRCQHIEYSDTVAANGHKAGSVVFENMVAATCTVAGSYDSVVYCSVCRVELSRDVVDVPAAGHKADSVVIENIVRPTLEAAGSYDSVIYCSVCKTEISRKKIDILASAVAVSKLPNKVEYKQGEKLDVAGGKLTVTYTDKSTEDFEMLSGWVSGFDSEKVGKQTLTVTFESVSSTLTTTFDVTVKEADNTAIDEDAAEISIYAYSNVIVVEAADAITGEIAVFDVNGRMVRKTLAAGTRTEIEMPRQGLYIVRVGNQAKRVVIK